MGKNLRVQKNPRCRKPGKQGVQGVGQSEVLRLLQKAGIVKGRSGLRGLIAKLGGQAGTLVKFGKGAIMYNPANNPPFAVVGAISD